MIHERVARTHAHWETRAEVHGRGHRHADMDADMDSFATPRHAEPRQCERECQRQCHATPQHTVPQHSSGEGFHANSGSAVACQGLKFRLVNSQLCVDRPNYCVLERFAQLRCGSYQLKWLRAYFVLQCTDFSCDLQSESWCCMLLWMTLF